MRPGDEHCAEIACVVGDPAASYTDSLPIDVIPLDVRRHTAALQTQFVRQVRKLPPLASRLPPAHERIAPEERRVRREIDVNPLAKSRLWKRNQRIPDALQTTARSNTVGRGDAGNGTIVCRVCLHRRL